MERFDWGFQSNSHLQRVYDQEKLVWEVAELLNDLLETENISRNQLAKLLEKSPAFVSRALNGSSNLTLRTLADIASTIGYEIIISKRKKQHLRSVGGWVKYSRDVQATVFDETTRRASMENCSMYCSDYELEGIDVAEVA